MLPDELDSRVRREARRRGVSIADLAREALDQHVPPAPTGGRRLGFFAIGEGGPPEVSDRAEEYIAEAINRSHRTGPRS